jgi:hypothetical protein
LAAHQDADQTPLLYIHRPIPDKDFHSKHKSGVFTPGPRVICMGKAILHTKPQIFSHTKNLRERHQKIFRAKFKVRSPPTGTKSHQLAKSQNGS